MILAGEQATLDAGRQLAALVRAGDVITLSGGLGAGKTTLARGLIAALGHGGEVPSPTFAIVQPYEALDPPVWHVDLYRIGAAEELEELGLDAAGEGVLIVEWPERAGAGAWPQALALTIGPGPAGERCLTAKVPAAWQGRWPPA